MIQPKNTILSKTRDLDIEVHLFKQGNLREGYLIGFYLLSPDVL